MSNLSVFQFESREVRTVTDDSGEVLFVGKDVAIALGYADHTNAIKLHCKGVAKHHPLQTAGGKQEVRVLNEADVLRLIVNSKLPAAEAFERWVFEEVLPSIHKTGSYSVPQSSFQLPTTFSEALRLAAEQAEQIERQQAQLAVDTPKAQALDRISVADGEMCITNAAKAIGVPPKRLFSWLEQNEWVYRRPGSKRHTAYQARIKSGYLTHKVTTVERADGSEKVVESVIVTPKGLTKLAEVMAGAV